jgi:uncharacterized protein YgiM (DUF1202 family)
VLGPIVLLLSAAFFAAYELNAHLPRSAAQAPLAVTVPAQASAVHLLTAPTGGVQLTGRVVGTPHLRGAPSSTSQTLQDLQAGDMVVVNACSATCSWYLVTPPGQSALGWVSSTFITIQGDEQRLTVVR